MNNKAYGWALVVLVLVFAVAAIFAYRRNHERANAIPTAANLAIYTNGTYGYTFYYPAEYTVRVGSDEDIIIGKAEPGFVTYDEARIATGTDAVGSYDAFVANAVGQICDASCSGAAQSSNYSSQTKLAGKEIYLNRQNPDGTTGRFGPVYVFNIGGNVENATYAALLVYRPNDATSPVDALPPGDIAGKLDIRKVERR